MTKLEDQFAEILQMQRETVATFAETMMEVLKTLEQVNKAVKEQRAALAPLLENNVVPVVKHLVRVSEECPGSRDGRVTMASFKRLMAHKKI